MGNLSDLDFINEEIEADEAAPAAAPPAEESAAVVEAPQAPAAEAPGDPAAAPVDGEAPQIPAWLSEVDPEVFTTLTSGKYDSAEKVVKGYQEIQRYAAQVEQAAEQKIEAERAQWQEYIEGLQAQQAAASQQPAFAPVAPRNREELFELAVEAPEDAFNFAANNAPDQVPAVLAVISQTDPVQAERLRMDYTQWQQSQYLEYERAQQAQSQGDAYAFAQAQEQATAQAWEAFAQRYTDWEPVRDVMAQVMAERQHYVDQTADPRAFYEWMEDCYDKAWSRSRDRIQAASDTAAVQAAANRGAANVERGTPAAAPAPVDATESDQIMNEIWSQQTNYDQLVGMPPKG